MSKKNRHAVGIIADTHLPFEHPHYLEFCKETFTRCKVSHVIHVGDLVDNHAISFHDIDPNGRSPKDEMDLADTHLEEWFKAFPKLNLCLGNHDSLADRKAKHVGLPRRCFLPYRDIWNLPRGWKDSFEWVFDGVLYKHGTGMSGRYAHVQAAERSRMSTVIGHTHSSAGVEWIVSSKDCIFAMNVGSGIDRHKYAFIYGKDFPRKPVLSCGVVMDHGENAQVFKMPI